MIHRIADTLGLTVKKVPRTKNSIIKETIKRLGHKVGYDIAIKKSEKTELNEHEQITTYATYSPWNTDLEFHNLYQKVRDNTLVDVKRSYEIWKLVKETSKLATGALLEVGTWKGGTGAVIAKQAKLTNIKDPVFLCDTFSGVVKAGAEDSVYKGGEHQDTSEEEVRLLLQDDLLLSNVEILRGIFPDETGEKISDLTFRFCHIDVDVYQSTKDIVEWLWPRLVPNGVIVFDDYGYINCDGVTKYVNELMNKEDGTVFYNLNGHAIVIKHG